VTKVRRQASGAKSRVSSEKHPRAGNFSNLSRDLPLSGNSINGSQKEICQGKGKKCLNESAYLPIFCKRQIHLRGRMAASPTFPALKSLHIATAAAEVRPVPDAPFVPTAVHTLPAGVGTRSARRRITPTAGVALEVLGHAIEYLADEYLHEGSGIPQTGGGCVDPQVAAMQILMAANRQVYFGCPVVTPFHARLRRFFGC
jgi:hypothetical protein